MPATSQSPPNAAINIALSPTITWANGGGATSYNVNFGTTSPPPFIQNQAGTSYSPGALTAGVTYYYRIDPKNHRIQELSVSSEDAPDVVYRVELGAYRWVKGTLFPFKEVHYQGDRRLVEIRFRSVTLSPEIPAPLFPVR